MAHGLPFPMLIDLAQREVDAAASALGAQQSRLDAMRQQGDGLNSYRAEYAGRMRAEASQGMTMASLRNYHQFLANLDDVQIRHRGDVAAQERLVETAMRTLQAKQLKLNSYQALAERASRAAAARQARVEQRQTDEFAARRARDRQAAE
ncbi:flagellar export protein FliJ [Chitinasiproducens palmae]|uniref:Flagellar FliJ protein n=1 Tax=Chitinasiproducens palmae TaxID=1770053 RepID=A0A1H2PJR4_9BURK|nr:flagellar export protein FliJ [Chitinasiproducens palmae]SDV46585.1 flagellar FliJ protein [Chitinasiproducens palmae]